MIKFSVSADTVTTGFLIHADLDLVDPIQNQLGKRTLEFRANRGSGSPLEIIKIIERNASLRIGFGWSFESQSMIEQMMSECTVSSYLDNTSMGTLITDGRCSWLGFTPLNIFDRAMYEDRTVEELIVLNNDLVLFQGQILDFISTHKLFLQHSFMRNNRYRYALMKTVRKDPIALENMFEFYLTASKETSLLLQIPKDILEEQLGCHFLHYPDLFFELLAFSTLKGDLYE